MPKIRPYEPKPERKLSPMLDPGEKEYCLNLGQSMNSKKVTSALGYLDLKQICYCLAQALNKHIQFSKGEIFLDDLKQRTKMEAENSQVGNDIEFSYNLKADMKIDVEATKKKLADKEKMKLENQKKFEELQK